VIMAEERRSPQIAIARTVIRRLDTLPADQADAVRDAIRTIGIVPGEPVDLPTARRGTPYKAQIPRLATAPVVIYRRTQPDEQGDWLVVSFMTPGEYRQQKHDEQSGVLRDPVVRQDIRIAAGTAVSVVTAIPGTVTTGQGRAASTISNSVNPDENKGL
jgi:hypothetical protein